MKGITEALIFNVLVRDKEKIRDETQIFHPVTSIHESTFTVTEIRENIEDDISILRCFDAVHRRSRPADGVYQ